MTENGDFLSPVWLTVHMYPVKTVIVNTSFQKCTPEWKFLKTPAFRLRADGLRACLHGGGGPQVGGVTRLSIQSLILI